MPLNIQPSATQLKQLLECAEINGDTYVELLRRISALDPPSLRASEILETFKSVIPERQAQILLDQLFSLSALARRTNSPFQDIIVAIREAIQSDNETERWDAIANHIQAILESSSLQLASKATELTYDYTNLLNHARIITDLRPLFSDSGEHVEAAIVSHTLRLFYMSNEGHHELSIALDIDDIRSLMEQCDRGIRKAFTTRDEFTNSSHKPCIVSGESVEAQPCTKH